MRIISTADAVRVRSLHTDELRKTFLLTDLFQPGVVSLAYTDVDRAVAGSAVPTSGELKLEADAELRSDFFCQRRELGILNVGGAGTVSVDGTSFDLQKLDVLYVGRGSQDIRFTSSAVNEPAQFYLLSYPAHAEYPTTLVAKPQAAKVSLGSTETLNRRTIYKYIHAEGAKSCQLVMGVTAMEPGSGWNTMPPHTHLRRSEVYMYFDLPAEHRVFHFMGEPTETRHLLVADRQAVLSPSWSIHSGVGTTHYTFCWGMGGENQAFDDMDAAPLVALR